MNIFPLYNLLIPLGFQGLIWTLLLLSFCFGGVYVANLARLGWEYNVEREKAPDPAPKPQEKQKEEKKTPAQKTQEPIYYIVEKKKRRPKSDYGEPKRIHFNNG